MKTPLSCLCSCFGLFCGLIASAVFLLIFNLYETPCPSVNGRECNNQGTCNQNNVCECIPTFSGAACEVTLCAGYSLGQSVCSARGLCSPLMLSRPSACSDWSSVECQTYISTSATRAEIPTCTCRPPWVGEDCSLNGCPQNIAFETCSGEGNLTVGLTKNGTEGNGCQCTQVTNFLTLHRLGLSGTLTTSQLDFFRTGVCGEVIQEAGVFALVPSTIEYKCYCNAQHKGSVCEEGLCPRVNGLTCNAHGHADKGSFLNQGIKCETGTRQADGSCKTCTGDWRCPSGQCVESTLKQCSRGFEYAYRTSIPRTITQPRNATLDLVLYAFTLVSGEVTVTYRDHTLVTNIPGEYAWSPQYSRDDWELNSAFDYVYTADIEIRPTEGTVALSRSPWLEDAPKYVRLQNADVFVLNDLTHQEFIFDLENPQYFLAMYNDEMLLTPSGRSVSINTCTKLATCVWSLNYTSGTSNLCNISNTWVVSSAPCMFQPTGLRGISILSVGIPRYQRVTIDGQWDVYQFAPTLEHDFTITGGVIADFQLISKEDMRMSCVCPPEGRNKSTQDVSWLESKLTPTVNSGEYAVGQYMLYGDLITVRGQMISESMMVTNDHLLVQTVKTRLLTPHEYSSGIPTCWGYPARDPVTMDCSQVHLLDQNDTQVICQCTQNLQGQICTCQDEFMRAVTLPDGVPIPEGTCKMMLITEEIIRVNSTRYQTNRLPFSYRGANTTILYADGEVVQTECYMGICKPNITWTIEIAEWIWSEEVEDIQWSLDSFVLLPAFYNSSGGYADVRNVEWNSATSWSTGETDPWLEMYFGKRVYVTSFLVEFETLGIQIGRQEVKTSAIIRGKLADGTWIPLGRVTDFIEPNTTLTETRDVNQWVTALRIESSYPMGLHQFVAFSNQICDWELDFTQLPTLEDDTPGCKCDNSCYLKGKAAGGDGYCSDFKFLSAGREQVRTDVLYVGSDGWLGGNEWLLNESISNESVVILNNGFELVDGVLLRFVNISTGWYVTEDGRVFQTTYAWDFLFCEDGTDCLDCGTSTRGAIMLTGRECRAITNTQVTLEQAIAYGVVIRYNYTTTIRTLTPYIGECAWPRCPDGSCNRQCPEPVMVRKGDGCVLASATEDVYKCVCEQHWGGIACGLHECVPGDTKKGEIDPHRWCSCGGPPPLKIKPPYSLTKVIYNTASLLKLNRVAPRYNEKDVGWDRVSAEYAPFGIAILRTYKQGLVTIYTTCPFRVRDRLGVFRQLHECVKSRETYWPYPVKEWFEFSLTNGSTYQIPWKNEVVYDDAPYRCPSGACVPTETDCYTVEAEFPSCNNHGKCMVDGGCKCSFGRETFIITEEESKIARQPYRDPLDWGLSLNTAQYRHHQCAALNCSEVDCGIPKGCYPGDKEVGFINKNVTCITENKGQCAIDYVGCKTGQVSPPLVCSDKGILRRRDYRTDEWYCECGSPKSNLFPATESIELVKNGFGGRTCEYYYCEESKVYFSKFDEVTQQPYKTLDGYTLIGRWFSGCGAPAGPSIDITATTSESFIQWKNCCPDGLERCEKILCQIAEQTLCVPIQECMGIERIPKIYECNGHGRALSDGTCECTQSEDTGYTYDNTYFSYKGCFTRVQCERALNGRVCNKIDSCGEFNKWTEFPYASYWDQQIPILLAREGLPISNQSLINRLIPGPDKLNSMTYASYNQVGFKVQQQENALFADVCVTPGDTKENPYGMPPYNAARALVILPYGKSLQFPSMVYTGRKELFSNCSDGGATIIYTEKIYNLTRPYKVDSVRIYGGGVTSRLMVQLVSGSEFVVKPVSGCGWYEFLFVQIYTNYNFLLEYSTALYQSKCPTENDECITWKQSECSRVGGIWSDPTLILQGCDSECCLTLQPAATESTLVRVKIISGLSFTLGDIQIFGHSDIPEEMPAQLTLEINQRIGQTTTCKDEKFMRHRDLGLGEHLSRYVILQKSHSLTEAFTLCEDSGGRLASQPDASTPGEYARLLAEDCYALNNGEDCMVAAQEISTPQYPPISYFFGCRPYGCHTPLNSLVEVFSTEDTAGAMWKTPVFTSQVPWQNVIATWNYRHYLDHEYESTAAYSEATSPFVNRYPLTDYAKGDAADDGSGCALPKILGVQQTDWYKTLPPTTCGTSTDPKVTGCFGTVAAPTPPPTVGVGAPRLDYSYWVASHVCIVTVYYSPMCRSAFHRFVLSPGKYDLFGCNLVQPDNGAVKPGCPQLSTPRFDQCPNGGSNCEGYNTLVTDSTASFSVQGPCTLSMGYLHYRTDGSSYDDSFSTYGRTPKLGTIDFLRFYALFNSALGGYYARDRDFWVRGCYPQIMNPTDPPYEYKDYMDCPATNPFPTYPRKSQIYDLRIFAGFENYKVTHRVHVEPYEYGLGTDRYTLGYLSHPYMCMSATITIDSLIYPYTQTTGTGWVRSYGRLLRSRDEPFYVDGQSDITYADAQASHFPYKTCSIPRCSTCMTSRLQTNWIWIPTYYAATFRRNVDTLREFTGKSPLTEIYIYLDQETESRKLKVMETTEPRGYARMISWLKPTHYRSKFDTDRCLSVRSVRLVDGGICHPGDTCKGEYYPILCTKPMIPLAMRDYYRYTTICGGQCDVCGDCLRTNMLAPGQTAFSAFPMADRSKYPFQHLIKDALVDGTLADLILNTPRNYDLLVEYLRSLNESVIFAFPEAIQALMTDYSERPESLSRGALGNPELYIDFTFKSSLPYDCGVVYNEDSGIGRHRCAAAQQYCKYETELAAVPMNEASKPTALLGYRGANLQVARCGTILPPSWMVTLDEWGFPVFGNVKIIELKQNGDVVFKIINETYWRNSGKLQPQVVGGNMTISGFITCTTGCVLSLESMSISATYGTPATEETLGTITVVPTTRTSFQFNTSTELPLIGWKFVGGTIITLETLVITTEETRSACQQPFFTPPWYEIPSAIDSGAPQHRCVFDNGGRCEASPASLWGGPSCEWPTITNLYGKSTCGNWGASSGQENGKEVNSVGIYLFANNEYMCKCNSPGYEFQARLSGYIYEPPYLVRNDRAINEEEFIRITDVQSDIIGPPYARADVTVICATESSTLPSWTTADEFEDFLALGPVAGMFLDLKVLDDGSLKWNQRNELVPNGTISTEWVPLGVWNIHNIIFNTTATTLTDGLFDVGYTGSLTLTVLNELLMVESFGTGSLSFTPACTPQMDPGEYICEPHGTILDVTATNVTELKVFRYDDKSRIRV